MRQAETMRLREASAIAVRIAPNVVIFASGQAAG
jgi:hypothetical protein